MGSRTANLDLVRLAAAFAVLWSHQFALTGLAEPAIPGAGGLGAGTLGVYAFFAISGYLNAQSLFRSQSAVTFLTSRTFRIFPALIACAAFCVVLGAFITSRDPQAYWLPENGLLGRNGPVSFFWRNSTILFGLDYQLPGVFEGNSYPRAVNGSLWTLPHEVKLYLVLAAIGFGLRFKSWAFACLMFVVLACLFLFGLVRPLGPLLEGKYLLTFGVIFSAGACLATIQQRAGLSVALTSLALLLAGFALSGNPTVAVLLAVTVVCVLLNQVPLPSWMAPKFDISYGVYLYAFPVQQLLSNWPAGFWTRLVVVVVTVTALGLASAKLVEQPALRWRRSLGGVQPIALPAEQVAS
ncbi:acyltransferase [Tardiphaga sp.]|uniref:acyltransferase family protein n=1 Tax=Tardiphaga sp. TaxID=1926292 RepID=UPI0026344DC5|nr:acyltransferase [Tardiphaga sp.]MDB5619261.1 acyltransferase [Tardiphaga sp.]